MPWPPTIDEFKAHLRTRGETTDVLDDDEDRLTLPLQAAVAEVERIHAGRYQFVDPPDPESPLPVPGANLILGTLMLAARLHTRKRSPDGLIDMGEMGSSRIPSFDPDIDRLLRIGRHAIPVVG